MASLLRRFYTTAPTSIVEVAGKKMNLNSLDLPEVFLPPINRSMQTLDKAFFHKVIPLAAASISDVRQITNIRKELDHSGDILKISQLRHLREDDSTPGAKCILLRNGIDANGTSLTFTLPKQCEC